MKPESRALESGQAKSLRTLIDAFVAERLEAKLDGLKDDEHSKRQKLQHDYSRENWLEDAAKRVSQIQLITHALKYTHPDARGTSIYHVAGNVCPEPWISSAGIRHTDDVVGNAAALDVFKFLKLEVDGTSVLERVQASDPDIKAAMCDDDVRAQAWCDAFAGIAATPGKPTSHTLAKQLYFPLPEGGYHLLSPLYASALAHRLYQHIQYDRFSDEAKNARKARREKVAHSVGHREHPNLGVRKFGGSKPQNISQLNSERGGTGYLLPSLPPSWQSQAIKPPLHVATIFSRWIHWGELKELPDELKRYLERLPREHVNVHMRRGRARRVDDIIDALLNRAAAVQQLPGGWSGKTECRLDDAESCWLDPKRAQTDENFARRRHDGDWPRQIGHRFGNWLNARIHGDRLQVGEEEQHVWKNQLREAIDWLQRELDDAR